MLRSGCFSEVSLLKARYTGAGLGQRKSARFVLYLWFGRSFGRKKPDFMGFVDGRGRRLRWSKFG